MRSREGRSRKVIIAVLPVAWNCVGKVDGRVVVDSVVSRSWIVTWDCRFLFPRVCDCGLLDSVDDADADDLVVAIIEFDDPSCSAKYTVSI